MKEEIINNVINAMMDKMDQDIIIELRKQLFIALVGYDVTKKNTELVPYDDMDYGLIRTFTDAKIAVGKSKATAKIYESNLKLALSFIGKSIRTIDEDDIRQFLYRYQIERNVGNTTLKNMRAYLNTFFSWLRKNKYITENPMDLVEAITADYTIKEPYSDEEIAKLKDSCTNKRDRALVDFLYASMVRVGEVYKLNRSDIDFTERECIVFGKGRKERTVYFDGEAKIHLQEYLQSRTDHNPALFVHLNRLLPARLGIAGIQRALKKIGDGAGVNKVHPHRFRRTGATRCLVNGIPIDQVQDLLGHADVKTTQIYAKNDRRAVKNSYRRVFA